MAEMPKNRWWKQSRVWRRIGSVSAMFSVALTAAFLSWGHIVHTVVTYGHQGVVAGYLYPVSIDGMMIVGVSKAADNRADGRRVGFWPRLCTWAGGLQSIAAQILSAWPYGPIAWAIAVVPSSSLIIVVETWSRQSKKDPKLAAPATDEVASPTALPETIVDTETAVPVPVDVAPVLTVVDDVAAPTVPRPKPRRRAPKRTGHAGAGATNAQVDAAIASLTAPRTTGDAAGESVVDTETVQPVP